MIGFFRSLFRLPLSSAEAVRPFRLLIRDMARIAYIVIHEDGRTESAILIGWWERAWWYTFEVDAKSGDLFVSSVVAPDGRRGTPEGWKQRKEYPPLALLWHKHADEHKRLLELLKAAWTDSAEKGFRKKEQTKVNPA